MSKETQLINQEFAKFLDYTLITPAMRKNPEDWHLTYWEKPLTHEVLCSENKLNFHTSYDSLYKVVTKINSLGYTVETKGNSCRIKFGSNKDWTECTAPLNAIFLECWSFLKWYNNNQQLKNYLSSLKNITNVPI